MTTTLDHRAPGALKITLEQRRRFDEEGFFLVENALTAADIEQITATVDAFADAARRARRLPDQAPVRVNNIVARHRVFRDLIDHAAILPLVVDVMGTRIQLRGSNLDVRPPVPRDERADTPNPGDFARHWHRDEPQGGWPTVDGVVPFLEIKVGYYLTDLTRPGSGTLRVIPGSHRIPADRPLDDPPTVTEINVKAGTALVFRTELLHNVAPNHSDITRKCLYLAYQHRWLRPSDYVTAPDDLLAQCTPIQRQLLGGVSDPANLVKDSDVEPCSTYWTPLPADLPLREWAHRHGLAPDHTANLNVTTPRQRAGNP
jgi:ectoine hydroxylase